MAPTFELLDHVAAGLLVSDDDGRVLYANATHAHVLGRPARTVVGRYAWELLPPGEAERTHDAFVQAGHPLRGSPFVGAGSTRLGAVAGVVRLQALEGPWAARGALLTAITPPSVGALQAMIRSGDAPPPDGVEGRFHQLLSGLHRLTDQERRVLACLVGGESIVDIADGFGRSVSTIRNHVQSTYRELRIRSRDDLQSLVHGVLEQARPF